MNFFTNFLIPLNLLLVYFIILAGIIYVFFLIGKPLIQNLKWILKYKILKKKYKDDDVAYCYNAYSTGKNEVDIIKELLLKGFNPLKVKERVFIFKEINKKMKGGVKNDR